jgi:hypothetical protein
VEQYRVALDLFEGYEGMLRGMVDPLPDERLAEQPHGVVNHPAWTVGHLAVGIDMVLELLGEPAACPDGWADAHAPGTVPTGDRSAFASKSVLLDAYTDAHRRLSGAMRRADPSALGAQMPVEAYRSFFPTVGHAAMYMLASHEPAHMGQLAVWRRAAGLMPSEG